MTDAKQPYRMGMWESFMYRCGYVRRVREEVTVKQVDSPGLIKARETAKRHFPSQSFAGWASEGDKVILYFVGSNNKAEIVGEEAKAILEAE